MLSSYYFSSEWVNNVSHFHAENSLNHFSHDDTIYANLPISWEHGTTNSLPTAQTASYRVIFPFFQQLIFISCIKLLHTSRGRFESPLPTIPYRAEHSHQWQEMQVQIHSGPGEFMNLELPHSLGVLYHLS